MSVPTEQAIRDRLTTVLDPEIRKPITELDMVRDVTVTGGHVVVGIDLTTQGCPLRDTIARDVETAVAEVPGVQSVEVALGVMSEEQRKSLRTKLRGGSERVIPFAQPGSLTRVYAITSGKGGVGKSTVTANLAAALAARGLKVGVLDADIYGFSIPRMLGVEHPPTTLDDMIVPPVAHGVKVISIGMFSPPGAPIVWRGPMLHRAMQQFLGDVFWEISTSSSLTFRPGQVTSRSRSLSSSQTRRSSSSPLRSLPPPRWHSAPASSRSRLTSTWWG